MVTEEQLSDRVSHPSVGAGKSWKSTAKNVRERTFPDHIEVCTHWLSSDDPRNHRILSAQLPEHDNLRTSTPLSRAIREYVIWLPTYERFQGNISRKRNKKASCVRKRPNHVFIYIQLYFFQSSTFMHLSFMQFFTCFFSVHIWNYDVCKWRILSPRVFVRRGWEIYLWSTEGRRGGGEETVALTLSLTSKIKLPWIQ